MKFYQITYDNTQGFDAGQIHNTIITSAAVEDWWHYLPNVYIVATNASSKYLADRIIAKFKGLSFLVTKIDLSDYNGVLNKAAWEWIRKKNNGNLAFKIVPGTPLPPLPPLLSSFFPKTPPPSNTDTALKALEQLLGTKLKS